MDKLSEKHIAFSDLTRGEHLGFKQTLPVATNCIQPMDFGTVETPVLRVGRILN